MFTQYPYLLNIPRDEHINSARCKAITNAGIDLANKNVLEIGAGPIGDITCFLINNGANVTVLEARESNIQAHKKRGLPVKEYIQANLNNFLDLPFYDIIISFGTLYHLSNAIIGLKNMKNCNMLILSTQIDANNRYGPNYRAEDKRRFDQSYDGRGCTPSIKWICDQVKDTLPEQINCIQPEHPDFAPNPHAGNNRHFFIFKK
tara:strand:- start:3151 stop:3762 length:612 start_codon:yes stop_codon:yes gene_type:complete